jgi:parvulin-like peptidyl-prolyl isomerase
VIRKQVLTLIGLMPLVALAAAGCGRGKSSQVIARVDGRPITQDQLFQALEQSDNGEAGRRVLDALIVRQLVRDEAAKRGIKVDQKELRERIEGLKDYVLAGTGKDWKAWLQDTGQSEQDIADRISVQILTAKLVLTEKDRQQYFEANQAKLKEVPHNNEAVIYRQIVVATKPEAEAIRKELEKAAAGKAVSDQEFGKLAEQRSLDPMTRTRGGMRGWWIKGKGDGLEAASPEMEKVLFALKPGQVSEPVPMKMARPSAAGGQKQAEAPEQWRLLMVDKHISPHKITLAANQDIIEDWMLNDPRFQFQLQQFFESLRAKAKVEVLAPRYRTVGEAYQRRREARERAPTMPMMVPQGPGAAPPRVPAARPGRR